MQINSFSRSLSVIIVTVLIYQSAIVAPAVNIALPIDEAARMLRFIWPIFFALIGLLGLVNAILSKKHKVAAAVNLTTVFSMATCYVLVPVINEARDSGNLDAWKALHAVTVALTFLSLVLQLGYTLRWYKSAPEREKKIGIIARIT